ncbi:glycosyltransferase family 9 protein [Rubrivivax gelatinosus]|uniref:glycosyltransferase family 9 protein n=1 Tax=Rubrivivax gelatinosus TaxID=28068 RepID=UPI0018CB6F5D|nr:glycosyltransferase family 9 protein [Rubrivivax gelatinosus]
MGAGLKPRAGAPGVSATLAASMAPADPYLLRDRRAIAALRLVDMLLRPLAAPRRPVPAQPSRVLVANGAHLGDLLLSLPAVAAIRRHWPEARVDLVCGRWAEPLARACGLFDEVHVFDHWVHDRSGHPLAVRWWRQLRTLPAAAASIRARRYELAIDLYGWFGHAGPLLRLAGVPVRVGFTSGGLGAMFTDPVAWPGRGHVSEAAAELLRAVAPDFDPGPLRPLWPGEPVAPPMAPGYLLVHTGTGAVAREWPEARWVALLTTLAAQGRRLVLAGAGARERDRAARLVEAVPGVADATGAGGWPAFAGLVRDAGAVICLESVCAHLAAAFERPTVCLFSADSDATLWGPRNDRAVLVRPPAAAGVGAITVDAVLAALQAVDPGPEPRP